MPKLTLQPLWNLGVTSPELTLIRAALSGRLRDDQKEEAKKLEIDLAEQTLRETRHRLGEADKLERNITSGK